MREQVTLECTVCGSRNYMTTRNKKTVTERLRKKKFCAHDRMITENKETH